ncbi:hypothetical protein SD81_018955 [Tolypothrix campylonemoides VB511288]|nr:hypothetical protein SD81_018955 [Tolypothrix campylonemoides VB511288]
MPDEIKPNPSQAPTHDAQLAADNIASGEEKTPSVDIEADYQAAQRLSVSEIDRTGEGAKAAQEATAPKQEVHEPQQTKTEAPPTGNPDDYLNMAKDVAGSRNEGATNVTNDLIEKALEKGQPKK